MSNNLRIATRSSPLALWQANFVKTRIQTFDPGVHIELIPITTTADKFLETPLTKIGGKALFVKELEQALLANEADIAVHSMKDVPGEFPDGLGLLAILEREEASDAFVSQDGSDFFALPNQSRVGTSSLRRQAQLLALRPDLTISPLRGNVNTRLKKLDAGEFAGIVLATAGLQRLGFNHRITSIFSTDQLLPAVGQGALAIEGRCDDGNRWEWLKILHHEPTALCVRAERHMARLLGGNCQVPIAGHATLTPMRNIQLRGLVAAPDGTKIISYFAEGNSQNPEMLGETVAKNLLQQGAGDLLASLKRQ